MARYFLDWMKLLKCLTRYTSTSYFAGIITAAPLAESSGPMDNIKNHCSANN